MVSHISLVLPSDHALNTGLKKPWFENHLLLKNVHITRYKDFLMRTLNL